MAAVFVGRGVVTVTALLRKLPPVETFATRGWRYYGPLCLILGGGGRYRRVWPAQAMMSGIKRSSSFTI